MKNKQLVRARGIKVCRGKKKGAKYKYIFYACYNYSKYIVGRRYISK